MQNLKLSHTLKTVIETILACQVNIPTKEVGGA